jgi:glycosyltransferase involved in cell wall biosynthesis
LRVGLDGRAFDSPAAGVRRYVHDLVPALLALGEPIELVALGGQSAFLPDGLTYVEEPPHPATNAGWVIVGLPRAAARGRVDLIHAPAYTAPFWAGVPVVLTIHDVSYARQPQWYPHRRDWLRRAFYRRSARAATEILTDSAFSAAEIQAAYGIPASRITVAHLGVAPRFAPAGGEPRALPEGVREPFALHVGDLHERRNLPMLVEAILRARLRVPGLTLVLAGVDRGVGTRLMSLARDAGAPEAVVLLGVVHDGTLEALYQHAAALTYPSRYEGFGLPVLEAMASGTPVVAARAASVPEVLGDAGLLLDPDDTRGWAEAVADVASDPARRARMRADGLTRAAAFTWARTARATVDVYRRAVRRG